MAFKMKNPSMAKMVKAAGDNRAAMKMKMEEKAAAAKMKREAAMKMKKESMAKLTEKASAMKKDERSYFQRLKDEAKQIGKGILGASDALNEPMGDGIPNDPIKGFRRAYKKEEDRQAAERKASSKKKSAAKMKKASPAKQKMNMVKGPDGKMVPDFAVDGKGANDLKSAPTKKRTVTKGEDGLKTVTRTNRKGVVRKTKTKGKVTDAFGRESKIKDKQTQSRDGSKVRIKTKTRSKVLFGNVKEKTKGVLSNRKGTDDYKTEKAKTSRRFSTGIKPGKKRTSKSTQNVQATQLLRSQDGFRSYKRPTTGKRAT